MSTKAKHIEQYYHNKNFAQKGINNTDVYLDWYIIAIFYSGLHLLEAYMAERNYHSNSHADRENILKNLLEDDEFIAYKALYNMSLKARYTCMKMINQDAVIAQDNLMCLEKFCKKEYVID